MFRSRAKQGSRFAWPVATGAAIGLTAGLVWARRRPFRELEFLEDLARLEERIVDRLVADPVVGARPLEVAALTPRIVELTGSVRDEAEARRAVAIAERMPGVRTVLNRLDVDAMAVRLETTRRRYEAGAPELHEPHWYGLRVGTGRRRQGHETDPDRPDEKVPSVSRSLGVNRATEQPSEGLDKLSPGVEGHTTVPAAPTDRGSVGAAPHRRLGNVPSHPVQEVNPAARLHENVKKGTRVTLEQSGLQETLEEREREERA